MQYGTLDGILGQKKGYLVNIKEIQMKYDL